MDWAGEFGLLIEEWPSSYRPKTRTTAGAEHYTWVAQSRWVKATYGIGNAFGLMPRLAPATGSGWVLQGATALEYLDRLLLANRILGDDIVLHAVMADEYGTVSILSSQPHHRGDPAGEWAIVCAMQQMGFRRLLDPDAFYREADNLAIFDLHQENAVTDKGILYAIDPIILKPNKQLRTLIQRRLAS